MSWKNRIVGQGEESPDNIMANPQNWRVHPDFQQQALKGVLDEVGFVQNVVVNQRTGHLIDGHLRVTLAIREGAESIPVVYVDLSPEDEQKALATLDPLSGLATADKESLGALLEGVTSGDEAVQSLLEKVADDAGLLGDLGNEKAPDDFPEHGEDDEADHRCPKCGYEWSGKGT